MKNIIIPELRNRISYFLKASNSQTVRERSSELRSVKYERFYRSAIQPMSGLFFYAAQLLGARLFSAPPQPYPAKTVSSSYAMLRLS
jgi:hypothetical protein